MAMNTSKCSHLMPLHFKGLKVSLCSSYDLCHLGLHTVSLHTVDRCTRRQADAQTDAHVDKQHFDQLI